MNPATFVTKLDHFVDPMTLAGRVVEFQPNLGFEQLSLLASPPS